ncbi:thiol:disulfide interchange protein DsbG [Marinospirillum alkaliphilum]|uniref:Thiol:disulfide interchange protein n=1 Tax=Marinospirillum alkaliphilum DSM 21637 TaxID=1122209 RepID=A0A1K1WLK9_9GAMM|nr:thiol:disulfide interchange protein DsbG [Marinospirillum alkaliphilum]SFX38035.1 thiol:disulfide interchange protein DsbG [Marinospirillum alkaliphilum DSM 21637]
MSFTSRFLQRSLMIALLVTGLLLTGLLMAGLTGNGQAFAQQAATQPGQQSSLLDLPEPIQHLQNQGLDILREFPVGASLRGWVVSFEGRDLIVYTTTDGEFLINGVLLNAQGQDLTEAHQKEWLPRPDWNDLASASYLTESSSRITDSGDRITENTLYVFFDANCPFCQLAWMALQPYRAAGLEVRWIPVAYLKPDSRNRAAALLSAPPSRQPLLLERNMKEFGQPLPELDKTPDNLEREQLQANMDLMQSLGINGTPGWVWQDADGKLHTHAGMLRLPRLPDVTGLPAQQHPEPALMRFR